jgi:hypothetical protein
MPAKKEHPWRKYDKPAPPAKPPQYVIDLASKEGGEVWKWQEYPKDSKVAIVLQDGRKFLYPMPNKPMSAGKSKSRAKRTTTRKPRKEKDA